MRIPEWLLDIVDRQGRSELSEAPIETALPKKVWANDRELMVNSWIKPYRNLTSWFFHRKIDGQYDTSYYDPQVFNQNYVQTSRVYEMQLTTLDLEQFNINLTYNLNWREWTRQYRTIMQMMRAAGREVIVYGIDPGAELFQQNWNLSRHVQNNDYRRAEPFAVRQRESAEAATIVADRFRDLIDITTSSSYAPYTIPSVDSWQMRAFLYHLEIKWRLQKTNFPDRPHYVWLQPNHTSEGFSAMEPAVWESVVKFAYMSADVDGIIVFTLDGTPRPVQWTEVFGV